MSTAILETDGWSRSQWVAAISLIIALHVLALFMLSERETMVRPSAPKLSNIHFVGDPRSDPRLAEWLSLQDPMVFVEMDAKISPVNLQARSRFSYELTNRTEPYRWLAPSDQYFADDFNLYVAKTVRPSTLLSEKIPAVLSEVTLPAPVFPARALLRLEGDLAGRRLISNQPPPANESSAILTNTVVGVRVDAAGETISAALISGSGLLTADQSALAFARQARFERLTAPGGAARNAKDGGATFGQLVFQWFPAAVTSTNPLTAKP